MLDPLDKELEARGHKFARYADDFVVMVKSAKAAERVMASLIRFAEDELKLVVNRAKSRAAPLKTCAFLGFQIGARGKVTWTARAHARFKERVREPERSGDRLPTGSPAGVSEANQITSRNRGHRVQDVIGELRLYISGWLNYFGISHTYRVVLELADWVRRRVRLYYWKQWSRRAGRPGDSLPTGSPQGAAAGGPARQPAPHAAAEFDQTGSDPRRSQTRHAQPQRVAVADAPPCGLPLGQGSPLRSGSGG